MQPAAILSVLVTANTSQASRSMLRFNATMRATESSSNKALGAIKTLAKGATIGAGAGLAYAVKKAADFESQLDSLGAVSNATGRQMDQLRRQAMAAGAATKFSALDAAEAQTELAKGGLRVGQIMRGGLKSALALAAAGELELADAAKATSNAMNLFGLKGKDAMKVADQLATAANATTADVGDFAIALTQGGSVAKSAGLSFRETVLALEALAKSGIKNSDAGTSLKTALIQLIKPTEKQAALADKLNVSFIDQQGHFKGLADISDMLRERLGGMTKAQRTAALATLAGTDGVRTLTALYDAGPAKLDKWSLGLAKTGTAAEVAAKKQDNLKGKLENLQGSVETIAIAFGSKLLPALTDAAEQVTDVLNDKTLSGTEKFDELGKMLADAIGKAGPIVGAAAAKVGVIAVRGFFNAFRESPLWLKLLTAGFILSKLGGFSAFKRVGLGAGSAMAGGITEGATKNAGRTSTTIAGRFKGLGGAFKTVGQNVLGAALITGIADAATRQGISGFGDRFQQFASTATLGFLPAPRDVDQRLAEIADKVRSWKGGSLKLSDPSDPDNSLIREKDLNDFTGRQRKMLQGLATLRNTATEFFGQDFKFSPKMEVNPEAATKKLRMLENEFGRMRSGAVTDVKQLREVTAANFKRIADTMGTRSAEGQKQVSRNFRLAVGAVVDFKQRGILNASQAGKQIAFLMKSNTGKGKDALSANMLAAEKAIARTMSRGGKITEQGTALIRALMVNAMQDMGLSPDTIRMSLNKRESAKKGPVTPGQTGLVVTGGKPHGDSVHAVLERGEVVVNRKAVQKLGGPREVNKINQAIPRFQGGGIVGLGHKLQKAGYEVGEHPAFGGVAPVHVPNSYHYRGMAIDVNDDSPPFASGGGEPGSLDKLYSQLKGMPGVVELLWRVAGHFNHLHVAMSGAGGKLGALGKVAAAKVPRLTVNAPDSMVKTMVQGALDKTREGANKRLRQLAPAEGSEPGVVTAPGGTYRGPLNRDFGRGSNATISFNQAAMLAEKAGLPGITYAQIAIGESGLKPGAVSPDGGYGLWQMTPRVQSAQTVAAWEKIGSYFNPWNNARQAKHLAGSGTGTSNYFGTGSVTDWNKHYEGPMKGLQRGGIVGMAEGGVVGAAAGKARAIPQAKVKGFVKRVWNQTKALGGAGFEEKMPKIDIGGAGARGDVSLYDRAGKSIPIGGTLLKYLANPGYPNVTKSGGPIEEAGPYHDYGLRVLVHEMAHAAQPLNKMKRWESEGGAEAFAKWASPQVYKALDMPYNDYPAGYPNYVSKVMKEKSAEWIQHGQFVGRDSFKDLPPVPSPYTMAKGGMVGYAGDSLGVGTIGPLRGLLDRKVEGHPSSGKTSGWGVGQLIKGAAQHVFDFGTNDATAAAIKSSIGRVDNKTGKKPIHVMTVNGTPVGGESPERKNKAIRAAAGGDVNLVDWAAKHKGQLDSLGHGAYPERARLIADSIRKATGSEKADADPKFGKIPGKGKAPLPKLLTNTLKGIQRGVGGKELKKRLKLLRKRVGDANLEVPTKLKAQIDLLSIAAGQSRERADMAGQLSVENDDGTTTLGVFGGRNEIEWVQDQLSVLFKLRNKLIDADEVVAERRRALKKFIDQVRERIETVKGYIEAAERLKERVQDKLEQAKKHKPQDKVQIKNYKQTLEQIKKDVKGWTKERTTLSGKVLPLFTGKDKNLAEFRDGPSGIVESLATVQGTGMPMERMVQLPPIGVLGGDIFTAQLRLQDLLAPKTSVTDNSPVTDSASLDAIKQLLRESNLRAAVADSAFKTITGFQIPGVPQFMGAFAKGGVALVGEKGPELAHMPSGTRIHSTAETQQMMQPNVNISVALFEGENKALVTVNGQQHEADVRRMARTAGRRLPSQGGGWT